MRISAKLGIRLGPVSKQSFREILLSPEAEASDTGHTLLDVPTFFYHWPMWQVKGWIGAEHLLLG